MSVVVALALGVVVLVAILLLQQVRVLTRRVGHLAGTLATVVDRDPPMPTSSQTSRNGTTPHHPDAAAGIAGVSGDAERR